MASSSRSQVESIIQRLRFYFNEAGIRSIKAIGKCFKSQPTDDSIGRSLTFRELQEGLENFGLDFTHQELKMVFDNFPKNSDTTISLDEFICALRPTLNPSRRSIVERAFEKIDYDHDGLISIEDLSGAYDVTKHPKYKSGEWNKTKTLREFLDTFVKKSREKEDNQSKEGEFSRQDFVDYYAMISPTVDRDVYFDFMVRNAWKL